MRFSTTQLALGAFAVWFFFIRKKPDMSYLGYQDGYQGIVQGEAYP